MWVIGSPVGRHLESKIFRESQNVGIGDPSRQKCAYKEQYDLGTDTRSKDTHWLEGN